jgi:hypothetical protein
MAGASQRGERLLERSGAAILGVARSRNGATAAALSYSVQRDRVLTGVTSSAVAAEIGSKLAVPGRDVGNRPAAIPDRAAARNPEAMLAGRRGTIAWLTTPIAYRVRSFRPGRSVVRIFASILNVAGDPGRGPGAITYVLRDITLTWADRSWRIRSVADVDDQPLPGVLVATDSDRNAGGRPPRDRVIPTRQSDSSGLFGWLRDADRLAVGPLGMGPVADAAAGPDARDKNLRDALAEGFARSSARDTTTPRTWSAATPMASRPTNCPKSSSTDIRCYEVLVSGTSFRERRVAIANLRLVGLAVSTRPDRRGSVAFDLPAGAQERVLGGSVRITSTGLPAARTDGAAWQRSVLPLSPTSPATGR